MRIQEIDYSAEQNTPQLAVWVPRIGQNLIRRRKFCNTPSACGGDQNFQGFASLLKKFTNVLKFVVISLSCVLAVIVLLFLIVKYFWVPDTTRFPVESKHYAIDSDNIIEELNHGNTEVFIPEGDTRYDSMILTEGEPVNWNESNYFLIAQAINEEAWGEPIEEWNLSHIIIDQACSKTNDGIQDAAFRFYRIDGKIRYESLNSIDPQKNKVWVYKEKYNPHRGKFKAIVYNEMIISSEKALQIAEENGGNSIRESVKDDCYILISYSPNAWDYDDGWEVEYISISEGVLGSYRIDPKTGKLNQ